MKLKLSVRQKLVGIVLVLGAVFFAVILLAVYKDYQNFVFSRSAQDLKLISELIARRVQADILDNKNYLTFVSSHNETLRAAIEKSNAAGAEFSEQEISERISQIDASWNKGEWEKREKDLSNSPAALVLKNLSRLPRVPIANIFITDKRGALVATTSKTEDYNQADEEWWQKIYKGGIGSFYFMQNPFDKSIGASTLEMACPVVDGRGAFIGVMKAKIEKDNFFSSIFNVYLGRQNYAGIVTDQGVHIYSLADKQGASQGLSKSVFDLLTLRPEENKKLVFFPGFGEFIAVSTKLEGGLFDAAGRWYIYCLRSRHEAFYPLSSIGWRLFYIWIAVMGCLYGLVVIIVRRFVEPLEAFKKQCALVRDGSFDARLQIATGDEFEELALDFNSMVDELRQSTVSKKYFNDIIQSISDILFVVNSSGVIGLVNRRACELLEYKEEELVGKEGVIIFSKKDRYIISWGLKGLIEEGALKDKKIHLSTKTGKEIEVFLGTRSIRDASGNLIGLVCLAKDMSQVSRLLNDLEKSNEETKRHKEELERSLEELTENRDVMLSILEDTTASKKELEDTLRKLRQTQEDLLQAEKMISLGQIAAGVAHEINNPLFVISGEAEMLQMDKDIPASGRESIQIIRDQVVRIGDIIKRLLEFSRKKETKLVPVDIHEIMKKSIELLGYQANALGRVEIVNHLSATPMHVNADQNQLQEVFLNIMLNAVQAMEEKGGKLTLDSFLETIHPPQSGESFRFKAGETVAVMRFEDTGIGMDEETRKRIFDPFFTTKKTGTGLGLSVCYGIIDNHGGSIEVESEPGSGSTFTVKLPLAKEGKKE